MIALTAGRTIRACPPVVSPCEGWFSLGLHFEWDRRTALANAAKHAVTFVEAESVFADPLATTVDDPRHSREEGRYVVFGQSDWGSYLAVMFTDRGDAIRIVSARRMTSRERREYERGGETDE